MFNLAFLLGPLRTPQRRASLTLSAFGQTVASTGSSTSAYQFEATSGYRTEGAAGLTLVGCRFYDAQVGRFITRDTYLDQAPYACCDGDPVNVTDPDGHDPPPIGLGGVLRRVLPIKGDIHAGGSHKHTHTKKDTIIKVKGKVVWEKIETIDTTEDGGSGGGSIGVK